MDRDAGLVLALRWPLWLGLREYTFFAEPQSPLESVLAWRINHFPTHFAPVVPNPHSVQNADFPLEGTEGIRSSPKCLLSFNEGAGCIRSLIDSLKTRINGDRFSGLR
eukprot:COSAG06_NODE_10938_length_1593_cov_42.445783_1_plen_107_part_10